jgi:hypothetical protein
VKGEHAEASALANNQGEGVPLFVNGNLKTCDLFIQSMEEIMSSPVSGIARSGKTRSSKRSLAILPPECGKKGAQCSISSAIHGLWHMTSRLGVQVILLYGVEGMSFPGVLAEGAFAEAR